MSDALQNREESQAFAAFSDSIAALLEAARHQAARSVNSILTATYWEVGRRIVEFEQRGAHRADYGEQIIKRLAVDLTAKFRRGFSQRNLEQMRRFYTLWKIPQTLSAESQPVTAGEVKVEKAQTLSGQFDLETLSKAFPLSWSQYVRLLSVRDDYARRFYETEALRGGWSERQLDRQINSMFYERTALSKNKAVMLTKHAAAKPEDAMPAEEEIRNPYVLEFLGLKDEYSEAELEEALIQHLESFLLELGSDFAFVARQKRIRVGDSWYRMDLLLFHRRLRCLVIIDLKVGKFDHADAGQMNLYVNYAAEHLTLPEDNPPVGLILCSEPDAAVAHYALNSLHNQILAAEYRTVLPDPADLEAEVAATRRMLESPARRNKGRSVTGK